MHARVNIDGRILPLLHFDRRLPTPIAPSDAPGDRTEQGTTLAGSKPTEISRNAHSRHNDDGGGFGNRHDHEKPEDDGAVQHAQAPTGSRMRQSFCSGRCKAFTSSHGAVSHMSISAPVVSMTGMALGCMGPTIPFGSQVRKP